MRKRWSYSLSMLITYVSVFVIWKFFPSRLMFVTVGSAAIGFLLYGMLRAHRERYFANRLDLTLHGWVIADLCMETVAFELFRLFQPYAVVEQFHNNTNFYGCTLAFVILLGGYRWFAQRGEQSLGDSAIGQAST